MFAAEHSVARADRVEARLESRVETLAGVPGLGRPTGGNVRELSIPDIQLVVRYEVDEERALIRILRVWHTRENWEEP